MARREASDPPGPANPPRPANSNLLIDWIHADEGDQASSEIGIASILYQTCLQTLAKVSKKYDAGHRASRSQKARVADSLARLCLFGDGLVDHGGLESCVKLDDELRGDVISLLCDLAKTLLRGTSRSWTENCASPALDLPIQCNADKIFNPAVEGNLLYVFDPVRSDEKLVSELKDLIDKASAVISQQATVTDNDEATSSSDDIDNQTSHHETRGVQRLTENDIFRALRAYTVSLMDLRPLLDQLIHDSIKLPPKADTHDQIPTFRVTDAAQSFVLQVHDKYREASKFLVERLGEANWQRYVRLKVADATDLPIADAEIPKSSFRPSSAFHDSGLGSSLPLTINARIIRRFSYFLPFHRDGGLPGQIQSPKHTATSC